MTLRPPAAAAADSTESQRSPLWFALIAAASLWCVLWFVHALGYWEDDAWIHLEFARSLARGNGWMFNGFVVYGDTSPLWVWLLDGFHLVLRDWMIAGKTLTAFGAVFALTGAYKLARQLTSQAGVRGGRLFSAAMVLLLVTNAYFGYWAFSGMEALAAAGLVCWGLVVGTAPRLTPAKFILGALMGGLAPLLRPEMGFFTLLLGMALLYGWTQMEGIKAGPRILLFILGLLLIAGPELAWGSYAIHTFGSVLPNTNAAKRADPRDSVELRLLQVYGLGFPLVLLAGGWLLAWWAGDLPRRIREGWGAAPHRALLSMAGAVLSLWTLANCVFYSLNHTYVQTRYVFVVAPVLTISLLVAVARRWPRLAWAGTVFGILFGTLISFDATWPLIHNKVGIDRDYAALAAFLRTLPPDAPVAHYSIGEAAYLSEHPIIDLGGITRPGVIPFLWDATDNRRVWWAHSQGARYAVLDHSPEPGAVKVWTRDVPSTGWFLNPHRYKAFDRLEVWQLPATPTVPPSPELPDHP